MKTKRIVFLIIEAILVAIFLEVALILYTDLNLTGQSWFFYLGLFLPAILLGFFFYILFWHETRPIKIIENKLQDALEANDFNGRIDVKAAGVLAELLDHLNLLMEKTLGQNRELEEQKSEIYTSNRVLQYQKKRLEAILDKVPLGILIMDQSNTVVFANNKIEMLLGVNTNALMEHKFEDWCKDEELSEFLASYQGNFHRTAGMEFSPSHLSNVTVSVNGYSLGSHNDTALANATLLVCRDVTQEVLANRARGEFISHISRGLKSPLNKIRMHSELLLGDKEKSIRTEAAHAIHNEIDRMGLLINNFMDISKIEMGGLEMELQQINPLDLLKKAFENVMGNGTEKKLKFTLDLPDDMSDITVDAGLMQVAIDNLLINAIKYNRLGGSVTLAARESDSQITFKVLDTGIGIASKDIKNIFEKFYRSEDEKAREQPGNGLGLTLAKGIIGLHQGILCVESEIDKGTEFIIILEKTV